MAEKNWSPAFFLNSHLHLFDTIAAAIDCLSKLVCTYPFLVFTFSLVSRNRTWKPDICLLLLSHASLETLKSKTEAFKYHSREHEISLKRSDSLL